MAPPTSSPLAACLMETVLSETGWVRRPLLADWLRGTPCLCLALPTCALAAECAKDAASRALSCESEDGVAVVVISVKILSIKIIHSACTFNYPLNKGKGAIVEEIIILMYSKL